MDMRVSGVFFPALYTVHRLPMNTHVTQLNKLFSYLICILRTSGVSSGMQAAVSKHHSGV
jgi:hypothetical protein